MPVPPRPATFLVVGDMHRHWRDEDRAFLEQGDQELVMFVGDLGDEDEEMVREIAAISTAKAVVLGNHDAWQSFSRRRPTQRLLNSLEVLDEDHIGYGLREVPAAGVSVIGARPFSWGGPSLRSPEVYRRLYGVSDMSGSAEKIFQVARQAQHRDLVILAHNGPTGLSKASDDIYGKDFGTKVGGDWGDPDLEEAIDLIRRSGWRVPCVVAGHMHHQIMNPRGTERCRFVRRDGTLYINPAVVPRARTVDGNKLTHYVRMSWLAGRLNQFEEIWVDETGQIQDAYEPYVRNL